MCRDGAAGITKVQCKGGAREKSAVAGFDAVTSKVCREQHFLTHKARQKIYLWTSSSSPLDVEVVRKVKRTRSRQLRTTNFLVSLKLQWERRMRIRCDPAG